MANPDTLGSIGGVILRSGLAAGSFLLLVSIGTGALPPPCDPAPGGDCTATAETVAVLPLPVDLPAKADDLVAPSLTHNDLIAATFELLMPEIGDAPSPAPDDSVLVASTAPASPTTRLVQTTTIRVEPLPQPAPLVEASPVLPAAVEVAAAPEPEIAAEIEEPEAVATLTDVVPEAAAATRRVAGQGVNVRSGPSKSAGKLFALAGGIAVTIGENQRGWLKVTDPKGRSGWVYKDYLL